MGPGGGGAPTGEIAEAITKTFGSFEALQEKINAAGAARFGSGWSWLVLSKDKKLEVISTPNQDSPIMDGHTPLLGVDVWEHAYYLKYQNKRPDYLKAWWNTVNWAAVNKHYTAAKAERGSDRSLVIETARVRGDAALAVLHSASPCGSRRSRLQALTPVIRVSTRVCNRHHGTAVGVLTVENRVREAVDQMPAEESTFIKWVRQGTLLNAAQRRSSSSLQIKSQPDRLRFEVSNRVIKFRFSFFMDDQRLHRVYLARMSASTSSAERLEDSPDSTRRRRCSNSASHASSAPASCWSSERMRR